MGIIIKKKYFIEGAKKAKGVVVIIDIFRAFSTASYILGNGADKIVAVRTAKQAFELKKKNPKYILIGENRGIKIKGFDFGNSPAKINKINFSGKTIVHRTSNGTQGIVNAKNASEIILGSFTTAGAIEEYLKKTNPETVTLIPIGNSNRRKNSEDWLYAEYLESKIKGKKKNFNEIREEIGKSESVSRKDFEYCLALDKFSFVMEAERENSQIIIKKEYGEKA